MKELIIEYVTGLALPPELLTFLLSALPISELRGAIPVAHGVFGMPFYAAFFWAYLGSLIPSFFILYAGEWLVGLKILSRKLEKIRSRFYKKHQKYGDVALVVFVAIPLPLTGVWSGSLAAVLFGIPFRKAFPLIAIGNAMAGAIVTLIAAGIFSLANNGI